MTLPTLTMDVHDTQEPERTLCLLAQLKLGDDADGNYQGASTGVPLGFFRNASADLSQAKREAFERAGVPFSEGIWANLPDSHLTVHCIFTGPGPVAPFSIITDPEQRADLYYQPDLVNFKE